jgi:5-methylcytosine-specific restriction endonuclease McrA
MTTEITPEMEKAIIQLMKNALSHKKHYQKNRDTILPKQKAYQKDHKEERAEYALKWYDANKDKVAATGQKNKVKRAIYDKARNATNKEWRTKYNHEYYAKNVDKILKHCRKYYQDNIDERHIYNHQHWLNNPAVFREGAIRHRALKYNAEGTFTMVEFEAKCLLYGNTCVYCGNVEPLTADHVIPLSKGGSNNIDNILPVCKSCNSSKKDKTFEEFLKCHTNEDIESILTRIYISEVQE